jgi:hypothetical protein
MIKKINLLMLLINLILNSKIINKILQKKLIFHNYRISYNKLKINFTKKILKIVLDLETQEILQFKKKDLGLIFLIYNLRIIENKFYSNDN